VSDNREPCLDDLVEVGDPQRQLTHHGVGTRSRTGRALDRVHKGFSDSITPGTFNRRRSGSEIDIVAHGERQLLHRIRKPSRNITVRQRRGRCNRRGTRKPATTFALLTPLISSLSTTASASCVGVWSALVKQNPQRREVGNVQCTGGNGSDRAALS